MNKKGFCKSIQCIRKNESLTLKQVSERSGINAGQLSRIEHGSFPTKITTIAKLQRGLGLTNDCLLNLLGFKSKGYVRVPIIKASTNNFGKSLVNAPTVSRLKKCIPKHSFIVKVENKVRPLIHRGSYALVNRDFHIQNSKIYAVLLDAQIIIGRIYKSKGDNYNVLITDQDAYFSFDYRDRYKILGQVIRIFTNI